MSFFDFFTDPVLRAPMWGTLLMSITSALIGAILFLQKRTLVAEALSHATYPGIVVGIGLLSFLAPERADWTIVVVFIGAFISSYLALKAIFFLQQRRKVAPDAALCLILSTFFGVGVLATSWMQSIAPSWNSQVQMMLFGQAATMTDAHIVLYGILALCIVSFVVLSLHPLKALLFDRHFASSLVPCSKVLEKILFWCLLIALVLGVRSVGVVLMSGMVVAPAVAARQFTNSFHKMLVLSIVFGAISGILGNILSYTGTTYLSSGGEVCTIPTGPAIVLIGSFFAFYALAFAKKRGLIFRYLRIYAFHARCLKENALKLLWKKGAMTRSQICFFLGISQLRGFFVLRRLIHQGWARFEAKAYCLTLDGSQKAASIIRLHRLWELYLTSMLKLETEKVHKTAEEMEHILTPEIEKKLTELLSNPTRDPHEQPIPAPFGGLQ